jgi:hypothetical protein
LEYLEDINGVGATILWLDEEWNERGLCLPVTYDSEWLISTRLDSDDMLHRTFIERLRSNFASREEWIRFPKGYVIEAGREGVVYERTYHNSPIVSLVERKENFRGPYRISHTDTGKDIYPYKDVNIEIPMWTQVAHGGNIKNNMSRLRRKVGDPHSANLYQKGFIWDSHISL